MTTHRRSRDLRSLLAPATPPRSTATTVETRVEAALLAWVNGLVDEAGLFGRLQRLGIWDTEGETWDLVRGLRGHLHLLLPQLREAADEHAEVDALTPCGPGLRSATTECRDGDMCAAHRASWAIFADVLATFREEVMTAVPQRARASVEASRAARDGMGEGKGKR